MEKRNCLVCGEPFTPKHSNQFLCSKACTFKYNSSALAGIPVEQKCECCGKSFYSSVRRRFCSSACREAAVGDLAQKNRKRDSLDLTLDYCKAVGISYADHQKARTLAKIAKERKGEGSDD